MSDEKPSLADRFILALLFTGIFTALFYGVTFGFFYFTADEVQCGNIAGVVPYCSGTYESSQELQLNSSVERSCYMNGERVNCSELENKEYFMENSYRNNFENGADVENE